MAEDRRAALDRRLFSVLLDADTRRRHRGRRARSADARVLSRHRWLRRGTRRTASPASSSASRRRSTRSSRPTPAGKRRCDQRGITDLTKCKVLPLSAGQFEFPDEVGHRVMRAITLFQEQPTDIPWSRPIEGVIAVRRPRSSGASSHFFDHGGDPVPPRHPNFGEGDWGPVRTSLRPLAITQPDGPSFQVDGNAVSGRAGRSASASTPARASSCTRSATTTAVGSGRSSTGPRSPRWSCPTPTRTRCASGSATSTRASTASAGSPPR